MELKTKIPETYFPHGALPVLSRLIYAPELEIRVVKGRNSKFGDFLSCHKTKRCPVITINNNLNPYAFLITFLHEYAHYLVWKDGHYYAKPHGRSWKIKFRNLIQEMLNHNIFPENLIPQLVEHIQNPKATSCADASLFKKLSSFDQEKDGVYVEDILDGEMFLIKDDQLFKRVKKVRKRILCVNSSNGRKYLFSPIYRVTPIKNQQYKLEFT